MLKVAVRHRTKSRQPKKERKSKKKPPCTKDISTFLTVNCNEKLTNGLSLPEVTVPSYDNGDLPKLNSCSCPKCSKEIPVLHPAEQSKENLPCNNVVLPPSSHSPHVIKTKNVDPGELAKVTCITPSKTKKVKENKSNSRLLTDYYPVRRSDRRAYPDLKNERQEFILEAIKSGIEDGFEVKEFPGKGRGVVTKNTLKRGDFALEYHGELIDVKESRRREELYSTKENTGCYMYYFKHLGKTYCIDATKETGRLGRLVNHSKKGNLKTETFSINGIPHLILVASRDIPPGVELLYDYGDRTKRSLEAYPWLAS